jgi:hypothetical protein
VSARVDQIEDRATGDPRSRRVRETARLLLPVASGRSRGGDEVDRGADRLVALELRHLDMKGKEPLHEHLPVSRGWRRCVPLIGFFKALLYPHVELLRLVRR